MSGQALTAGGAATAASGDSSRDLSQLAAFCPSGGYLVQTSVPTRKPVNQSIAVRLTAFAAICGPADRGGRTSTAPAMSSDQGGGHVFTGRSAHRESRSHSFVLSLRCDCPEMGTPSFAPDAWILAVVVSRMVMSCSVSICFPGAGVGGQRLASASGAAAAALAARSAGRSQTRRPAIRYARRLSPARPPSIASRRRPCARYPGRPAPVRTAFRTSGSLPPKALPERARNCWRHAA